MTQLSATLSGLQLLKHLRIMQKPPKQLKSKEPGCQENKLRKEQKGEKSTLVVI